MRKSFFPGTTGIFALFFVPYIVTIIFNGANTTLINKKFNVEMLLPVIVSSQIEDKYELETIKAQTIIARSNFYRTMKEEKNLAITLCQIKEEMEGKSLACVILQNKYEKAVTETEGKVIVWNKELKLVPYHELSKNVLPERIEIKSRDSAGYVTEILADGKVLEGEAFRKGMGLTSSNFTIQKSGKEIRFLCRGKGHGLGFSQYGGNEMAKESANAKEILQYYFPEMDVRNIKFVNC